MRLLRFIAISFAFCAMILSLFAVVIKQDIVSYTFFGIVTIILIVLLFLEGKNEHKTK
jgi:hypothetical protein